MQDESQREAAAATHLQSLGVTLRRRKDGSVGAVSCSGCESAVNDDVLSFIAACDRLREVNLAGSSITDTGVAHLAGLEGLVELDLSRTHVTADGARRLAGLPRLKLLTLTGCPIGADELRQLRKEMVNTRIVFV